jgi:DNA-binding NarL/FixJ family response regulator
MTKPNIQIDDVVREMTDEEYEIYLAEQEQDALLEAERVARAASRESALAKLAALGLTEDEIATL